MADIWFYHLDREPLDTMLVKILGGLSARGDRATAHFSSRETIDAISQKLWAEEDTGFPAHGCEGDPSPEFQPLWLTTSADAPNRASFRFYCEGCLPVGFSDVVRASILFDGNDEAALTAARAAWKTFKADGHSIKYWRQNGQNRWEDQAARE